MPVLPDDRCRDAKGARVSLQVKLEALRVSGRVLLQGLQWQVGQGAIHTVMGPSGCGKSSLLAAICGTMAEGLAFDGEVYLNGERIDSLPTERRRVAILFQDDLLFPHMTVFENLLFAVPAVRRPAAGPGQPARLTPKDRKDRVSQGLADLGMAAFAHADPATLSGGQRARISLMRALLAEPQALLLDEPFSRLDTALRERTRRFVFDLVARRKLPVLLVTHDEADIADPALVTRLDAPHFAY
jgi:putative thiamine transport system ATP-binding protein